MNDQPDVDPDHADAPGWTCTNGHHVPGGMAFCGVCGSPRSGTPAVERNRLLYIAGFVVAVVAIAIVVGVLVLRGGDSDGTGGDAGSPTSSGAPVLTGSVTIIGGGGYTTYDPCHGYSGNSLTLSYDYTDFFGGAPVRVLDASGTIVGSAALDDGKYEKHQPFSTTDGCKFTFTVPLDAASTRYQLIIGTEQPYDFTAADLSGLDLSIGPGAR